TKPTQTRRHPAYHRAGRHVASHHRACADHRALADFNSAHDHRTAADRRAAPHHRALQHPVLVALGDARAVGRARRAVVDEDHAVADEDLVFDRHARADEAVAGDFAAAPDCGIALDLDERAEAGFLADFASIEVDKRGQAHAGAEPHIVGYASQPGHLDRALHHRLLAPPGIDLCAPLRPRARFPPPPCARRCAARRWLRAAR